VLGQAAMVLLFDVVADAIPEHDEWHTHEHLPERLSIPGFLRGTRWVATSGQPGYFVMYEVAHLDVLTSTHYLERLNNPTPWTSKMMPHYRGMARSFCSVAGRFGFGMGHAALLVRFSPATEAGPSLRQRLLQDVLPQLPSKPGIGTAQLLEATVPPPMTNEQRIRGHDAGIDWAILVTGYDQDSLANVMRSDLGNAQLEKHGATGVFAAMYRMDYSVAGQEFGAAPA